MGDESEARQVGVWYAAAWYEPGRPGGPVIRVSMTTDVVDGSRVDAVCRDADEACALLRRWLDVLDDGA